MMNRRRLFAGLILLCFVAFFVWRITHFPYRPELLRGPIPPQANLVSEHLKLADRWTETVTHPLVRGLLQLGGMDEEALADLGEDAGTRAVVDRLASRHVVLAHIPRLGLQQAPAWVFTSWVGVQGQLMRWGAYNAVLSDFEPHRFSGGRRGWVLPDAGPEFGHMSLALVVTEGVLLGCLSTDPEALSILIYRLEHRVPPVPGLLDAEHRLDAVHGPWDQVLFGDLGRESASGSAAPWSGTWSLASPQQARGHIRGPAAGPLAITATNRLDLAALGALLGDAPALVLVAPTHMLAAIEGGSAFGDAVRLLWRRLSLLAPSGSQGFLMVGSQAFSGRMMGFKVPTVVGGFPLADAEAAQAVVGEALVAFNTRFDTTLERRSHGEGADAVSSFQSVRLGPLSGLSRGERPAYQIRDGWFLFSSNRDALEKLTSANGTSDPAWARELATRSASSLCWVDLAGAQEALGNVVAVLDLVAIAGGDREGTSDRRQRLSAAREGLTRLGALQVVRAWGDTSGDRFDLQLELGTPAP